MNDLGTIEIERAPVSAGLADQMLLQFTEPNVGKL